MSDNPPSPTTTNTPTRLPRITIEFCTQCRWNLRAAYYAQELLQTFSTALGEVALVPSTGGAFVVKLYHLDPNSTSDAAKDAEAVEKVIWDRKVDGGFPETKELKGRVRDSVEPGRGLGHTDRALKKGKEANDVHDASATPDAGRRSEVVTSSEGRTQAQCDDCK